MSEVLYRVRTPYDKAACDALAYLMVNRIRRWPRFILLGTGLLSIAFAAWYLAVSAQVTVMPLLLLLVGNALSIFALFARQFAAKMLQNAMGTDTVNTYLFTMEEMTVRDKNGDERAFSYGWIKRLLKMSGYLFFYMRDGQMYLVQESELNDKAFEHFLDERVRMAKEG